MPNCKPHITNLKIFSGVCSFLTNEFICIIILFANYPIDSKRRITPLTTSSSYYCSNKVTLLLRRHPTHSSLRNLETCRNYFLFRETIQNPHEILFDSIEHVFTSSTGDRRSCPNCTTISHFPQVEIRLMESQRVYRGFVTSRNGGLAFRRGYCYQRVACASLVRRL